MKPSTTSDPHCSTHIGTDSVHPVQFVRNLRMSIDSALTMRTHVSRTVSSCFPLMPQLRSIRQSVIRPVLLSLVVSLVLTLLDYSSVILAGQPRTQQERLQSVLNAMARLVYLSRKYDHITPLVCELHWLRVQDRIDFRLAVIVYRCLHGQGPQYLMAERYHTPDRKTGRRMRSSSTASLVVPRTKHSTIGDRAFLVAAVRVWNGLSLDVGTGHCILKQ